MSTQQCIVPGCTNGAPNVCEKHLNAPREEPQAKVESILAALIELYVVFPPKAHPGDRPWIKCFTYGGDIPPLWRKAMKWYEARALAEQQSPKTKVGTDNAAVDRQPGAAK
jgi:hypothetical protein